MTIADWLTDCVSAESRELLFFARSMPINDLQIIRFFIPLFYHVCEFIVSHSDHFFFYFHIVLCKYNIHTETFNPIFFLPFSWLNMLEYNKYAYKYDYRLNKRRAIKSLFISGYIKPDDDYGGSFLLLCMRKK